VSGRVYRVKEMVYTIQGEGSNTGTVVVLCRFEGCNLSCSYCDTDFEGTDGPGGGVFPDAGSLVWRALKTWKGPASSRTVLCTGGEPLLQLDRALLETFHREGFRVLLETNGTMRPPPGVDFLCVSPKNGAMPVVEKGDELKVPFRIDEFPDLERYLELDFTYFYLQPVWGSDYGKNLERVVEYCLAHPRWRLSLQTQRFTGLP